MRRYLANLLSSMSSKRSARTSAQFVDVKVGLPLSEDVEALRQGDVLELHSVPIQWDRPGDFSCPEGVVIVSQSCDVVRRAQAELQVSPIVHLEGPELTNALSGRQPRYAHISTLGNGYFADLSIISTIHKQIAIARKTSRGINQSDSQEMARFARAIARRFDRFAFPDEIVPWIRPLQDVFRSKALNRSSPLFRPVAKIEELRLESIAGWTAAEPHDLVLLIVLEVGTLPEVDPDSVELPSPSATTNKGTPGQVASSMPPEGSSASSVIEFWEAFGDSLARLCQPPPHSAPAVMAAVRSFTAEVISEDELMYSRVRRSAEIDLDHLSDPGPY